MKNIYSIILKNTRNISLRNFSIIFFHTTFVEYQVVRIWEDILEFFPDILESKSKEIQHFLDVGYLTNSPKIWICSDKKNLIINWDNQDIQVDQIPV